MLFNNKCCWTNSIFKKTSKTRLNLWSSVFFFFVCLFFYQRCPLGDFFKLETKNNVNCIIVRIYKGVQPSSGGFTGELVVSNCTCNFLEFFKPFLFYITLGVINRSTWETLSPFNVMTTAWSLSSIDGILGVGAGAGGGGFSSLSRPLGKTNQSTLTFWHEKDKNIWNTSRSDVIG